jgi:hypothetical protein
VNGSQSFKDVRQQDIISGKQDLNDNRSLKDRSENDFNVIKEEPLNEDDGKNIVNE